ncbi:MAG: sensor protein [Gemmatimonadetes bacterium]|nr:sensor protein [Gemmatimonadota bacterium]
MPPTLSPDAGAPVGLFPAADGEMARLCRELDWASTPLGDPAGWSQSLRVMVSTVLASRHPMFLWWGPELVQVYNDGYRRSLGDGGRHPRALGMRGKEFWTDIWETIGPQIRQVMDGGEATWHVDQLVAIERNGGLEEVYWTYSYSAVPDDDGSIGGTLVVCQETTERVLAERRLGTLNRLASVPLRGSVRETAAAATRAVESPDVPFALCWLAPEGDPDGAPELVEAAGLPRGAGELPASLVQAVRSGRAQGVELAGWDALRGVGPWPEPPEEAAVFPLQAPGVERPLGMLALGLSSRLPSGEGYEGFLAAAAAQVSARVAERRAEVQRETLLRELDVERSRLEFVFQQAPAFLAVLRGPRHVFSLVNEAYYQLVGQRRLVGVPAMEALPEVREQGFQELLDGVLRTGVPYVGREVPVQLRRTPGREPEERFVDLAYLPLVEAGGVRAGIIAHGTDVTEHVLARREVEAARAQAEAANRAKGEFLAVMSHELRTPLNAIGGYAELLEMGIRGPINDAQREDLRRIQTSQRHLLGLINEVLNYAKLETGMVHYDLAEVPVRETLAFAEALVAPQARGKGLALRVRPCDGSLAVRADGEKLRQILVNLLSNAVKFTEAGGSVALACDAEGAWADFHVSDTGMGIPADKLEPIFEPFVQVRSDLARPQEGTGLGLAISRDLARGMGGDLWARSTPGQGSTFTLRLPLAD